ncbi:MAG: alpha-glucosidase/alpha-galactosidase [Clostridiaceae bacterium]|jgi:alpha-galactosidase|nr:alpha-glucosidase/alpha-galactosidase [Clostridiaceae bacterium]
MIRENGTAKDIQIAYIGGGSMGWAWGLMSDLAAEKQLSGTVRLYDIDSEAARRNEKIGQLLQKNADVKSHWDYRAVDSLQEALKGSDFVVISILPATFDEMEVDVHYPEKYGIYQSVGDTVGPGGLVRALRTVPMVVEIANAIKNWSPDAWVINYTNPMTLCIRTLYEVFPKIKAFGCCHEVFGTQDLLKSALADIDGIDAIHRRNIKVNVLGINHFTWLDKASYEGRDLFPVYQKFVDKYYDTGFEKTKKGHWMNDFFASANRVKFDLFKRYGIIAAAGDRHLAEFCPPWYLKDPETAKSWMFGLTPVSWRKENLVTRLEKSKRLLSGEEVFELAPTGEDGILQMKAIAGLGDFVTNVNLPNYGQISNLPIGAVVETNAIFSHNSVIPVQAGSLPDDVQSLVYRHVVNQETTLRAAFNKDKNLAFRAFANDPLMTANIKDAWQLFSDMLKATKEYLPGWDID